jgi:hypothetical protein
VRVRRTALAGAGVLALTVLAVSAATAISQLAGPPRALVQYGYVRTLVPAGSGYRVRFDPALFLSGETANRAAAEDGVVPPGEPVPNDYYIRNETKKQLTYRVPANAKVTVVTNDSRGVHSTRIAVSELAAIVRGRNPKQRKLFGPYLGFWARTVGDRVTALDQQYQP